MACLADGHCPILQLLMLRDNDISPQGLKLLMAGQWPQLDSLTLCNSAENGEASSLVSYATCASSGCSPQYHILASEDMAADCHGVWPKLAEVQFVPGWTSRAGLVQETFMQTER